VPPQLDQLLFGGRYPGAGCGQITFICADTCLLTSATLRFQPHERLEPAVVSVRHDQNYLFGVWRMSRVVKEEGKDSDPRSTASPAEFQIINKSKGT
jgi:hypothetical protein